VNDILGVHVVDCPQQLIDVLSYFPRLKGLRWNLNLHEYQWSSALRSATNYDQHTRKQDIISPFSGRLPSRRQHFHVS